MSCGRCGSDRLYQFEASKKVEPSAPLPLVCRQCGQITVGGAVVHLPETMEQQAVSLADAALVAGKETRLSLEDTDPKELRIEKYFANVYQQAYLDGFFRCLAFYQHQAKEGRLKRLRALWNDFSKTGLRQGKAVQLEVDRVSYNEFEQLICYSPVPEKPNAQSVTNEHPTDEKGSPQLP